MKTLTAKEDFNRRYSAQRLMAAFYSMRDEYYLPSLTAISDLDGCLNVTFECGLDLNDHNPLNFFTWDLAQYKNRDRKEGLDAKKPNTVFENQEAKKSFKDIFNV